MNEHPSRFMLERHFVGDLPPVDHERTRHHLASCGGCRNRVSEFQDHAERVLKALPPHEFVAKVSARTARERQRSRFRASATVGALAAAAALALVVGPQRQDVIALRGTGMQIHRNRGGVTQLLASGERVRSGDALRVVVTLPRAEPVDVWFVDANGRVDRLLEKGPVGLNDGEQVLPGSVTVDTPCSDMWVVVGVAEAASSAESTLRKLGPAARAADDWVPKGCLARRIQCE